MKGILYKTGKFLSWVAICSLLACTHTINGDDDPNIDPDPDPNTLVKNVTIQVGAANTQDTKAMHGDEYATEGEFIHSLHLFIVSNGFIDEHITLDDATAASEAAVNGNLPNYLQRVSSIAPGQKTIYAFANMENVYEIGGQTLDAVFKGDEYQRGKEWDDEKITNTIVKDPMSLVDIANKKFIPMSVKQNVTVVTDDQQITVSLVRLVAKMSIALTNNQGASLNISKVTISSFADEAPMFAWNDSQTGTKTVEKTFDTPIVVNNDESKEVIQCYVNETHGTEMFCVKLVINGTEYTGLLNSSSLQRNHYLPVVLYMLDSSLILEFTADVTPIGGYPTPVVLGQASLTNNYLVNLPEGCRFTMKGHFLTSSNDTVAIESWRWKVRSGSETMIAISTTADEDGSYTDLNGLEGNIVGLSGQDIYFDFDVYKPIRITGAYLHIHTVPLQDWDTTYPAAALLWGSKAVWYEPVGLTKGK